MEAKEKAEELVKKYYNCELLNIRPDEAIECAIIAVDEIVSVIRFSNFDEVQFWADVKNELLKMKI